jgi:hypothetical protein
MASNFYFNNFINSGEQSLIEDLVIESIRVYGLDLWYIPRTLQSVDSILNEDAVSTFDNAYMVEMYVKSVDGFGGDGDFLSKFGLQIRDSVVLTVARRTFYQEVANYSEEIRPNEGDLIYFPLNKKIFEIKFVEHEAIFYQLGSLQTFDLRCELFEFSDERFNTGNPDIDNLFKKYDKTSDLAIANVDISDALAQNSEFQLLANTIIDFTETNPFGENI